MQELSIAEQKLAREILQNKERRVQKQQMAVKRHHCPIISMSVNMPGLIKLNESSIFIFETILHRLFNELKIKKINCEVMSDTTTAPTGPEIILCVRTDAKELKELTTKIEDEHELGRFIDIDVIDKDMKILHRPKHKTRRCFVCNNWAKNCARNKSHTLEELLTFIDDNVRRYRFEDEFGTK